MFVKFSLIIHTPHKHTSSKNSFGQADGSFSDIWVWFSSAGFSRMCLYSIIDQESLTITEKPAHQEWQRCTFVSVHLVHIRVGVVC